MRKKSNFLVRAAAVAAIYTVLTFVSSSLGLSSGAIQIRISEALTVLPIFMPEAVPGLFIGCLAANLLTGSIVWDVIFGSLATLIGAFFTYFLRKKPRLALLPPIISNTLIVPFVLAYAYKLEGAIWYFMLTVGIGEVISCGVLGYILMNSLKKFNIFK